MTLPTLTAVHEKHEAEREQYSLAFIRRAVDTAWLMLVQAANKNSPDASRFLNEAFETALKQEREHRAMGARFTHGQASYRVPCHYAAKAIVLNHFALGCEPPRSWAEAMRYRHDCALAYAVRVLIDETDPGLADKLGLGAQIDYAKDIANG